MSRTACRVHLRLSLRGLWNHAGMLPSNWASGLFRLTPSNQPIFEQAVGAFLQLLDNTTLYNNDGTSYQQTGIDAGTTATLAAYQFSGLALSGSIPASWSNQCKAPQAPCSSDFLLMCCIKQNVTAASCKCLLMCWLLASLCISNLVFDSLAAWQCHCCIVSCNRQAAGGQNHGVCAFDLNTCSIEFVCACAAVTNAVYALGLKANAEEAAGSPQYPHMSINVQYTNVCGSLPANLTLNEGLGSIILNETPTLPACSGSSLGTAGRKLLQMR